MGSLDSSQQQQKKPVRRSRRQAWSILPQAIRGNALSKSSSRHNHSFNLKQDGNIDIWDGNPSTQSFFTCLALSSAKTDIKLSSWPKPPQTTRRRPSSAPAVHTTDDSNEDAEHGRIRVLEDKLRKLTRENARLRDAVEREADITEHEPTAQLHLRHLEGVAALRADKDKAVQEARKARNVARALKSKLQRSCEIQQSTAESERKISPSSNGGHAINSPVTASAASNNSLSMPERHAKIDIMGAVARSTPDDTDKPCSRPGLSSKESMTSVTSPQHRGRSVFDCSLEQGEQKRAIQLESPQDRRRDYGKYHRVGTRCDVAPKTLLAREEEAVRRRNERAADWRGKHDKEILRSSCFRATEFRISSGPDWATMKVCQDVARRQRTRERAKNLAASSSLPPRMAKYVARQAIADDYVGGGGGEGREGVAAQVNRCNRSLVIRKREPEEIIGDIKRRQKRRWEASLVAAKESMRATATRPRTPPMEKRRRIQEAKRRAKDSADRAAREGAVKVRAEEERRRFKRQLAMHRKSVHKPGETAASRKKAEETRRKIQQSPQEQDIRKENEELEAARQREVSHAVRMYVQQSEARRRKEHGAGPPLDELVKQKQEEKKAEFRQRWQHNRQRLRQALRRRPNLIERQDRHAQLHSKRWTAAATSARAFLESREGFMAAGRRASDHPRSQPLARENFTPTNDRDVAQMRTDSVDRLKPPTSASANDGQNGMEASAQNGDSSSDGGVVNEGVRHDERSKPESISQSSSSIHGKGHVTTHQPPEAFSVNATNTKTKTSNDCAVQKKETTVGGIKGSSRSFQVEASDTG